MAITLRDLDHTTIKNIVAELGTTQTNRQEVSIDGTSNVRSQTRRAHVRDRFQIMTDDYDSLADRWIRNVWREPVIVSEIQKHVLPLLNPPKRAVDRLAVAYTHLPVRRIEGDADATKLWAKVLKKSHFSLHMRQFNRDQISYNTIVVMPLLRKDADGDPMFDFDVITGAIGTEISEAALSEFEPPDILFWRLPWHSGDPEGIPAVRAADREFFLAFDRNGKLLPAFTVRHNLGIFPGTLIRGTIPSLTGAVEDQWWDPWPNKGAFRAMESVTRIVANLDWTRKTQCRYLIAEIVDDEGDEGAIKEQVMGDAEGLLRLTGEQVQLAVNNIAVAVKDFKDHVRFLQDEALEVMTGAVASLADPDPAHPLEGAGAARAWAAVDLHRQAQVEFLRPADLRLQRVMATILKSEGSSERVDPMVVKDKAEVEFMPMPFVDDRTNRLNWYILASKFGITDQVMAAIEFHGWTEEEALERLKAIAERKADLDQINVERNSPKDPIGGDDDDPGLPGEGLAARQGRKGGQRTSPPSEGEAAR
jgi:hypothetical protein